LESLSPSAISSSEIKIMALKLRITKINIYHTLLHTV